MLGVNTVLANPQLVSSYITKSFIEHQRLQRVAIKRGAIGIAGFRESIHRPVHELGQSGQLLSGSFTFIPILLHTADEVEQFKVLQTKLLRWIRKAHLATIGSWRDILQVKL